MNKVEHAVLSQPFPHKNGGKAPGWYVFLLSVVFVVIPMLLGVL